MVSFGQDTAQTAVSTQGDKQPLLGTPCIWVDITDRCG